MKRIHYITLLIALLITSGCTDFDHLNKDPSKSTNMDPVLLIPTVQMRQSENHQEWARYLSYPGGFMQYWTGSWAVVEYGGKGKISLGYMEQMWNSYYPTIVRDIVDVVDRTSGVADQVNVNAMARILKVQAMHKMTDHYGDIPYFDAGKGAAGPSFTPKYDKQEDIYNDMLNELKAASEALNSGVGAQVSNDLFYAGNIDQWKKLANSLRLRLGMRLTKIDPARAKKEVEEAFAAGVFSSNADICYVKHERYKNSPDGEGKGNGLAIRLSNPEEPAANTNRISREVIKKLEDAQDPRVLYYGGSYLGDVAHTDITDLVRAQKASYADMALPAQTFGWDMWEPAITIVVNGKPVSLPHNDQRLQPSKYIIASESPYVHLSYAEVEFLLAEAAQRGWSVGGSAATHYAAGLEAAIRQWTLFGVTINEAELATCLAAGALQPANELEQINTQLWLLHVLNPIEGWANWRRSGYPQMTFFTQYPTENESNMTFPRRMQYPLDEQKKNKRQLEEAISRIDGGKDDWTKRVWWDAN